MLSRPPILRGRAPHSVRAAPVLSLVLLAVCTARAQPQIRWDQIPALPDAAGFAAPFAGVSCSTLILAGGANFPGKKPWNGGTKVWHDDVFAWDCSSWQKIGKLPKSLAYGVSVTFSNRVVCIGGSDADRHYSSVFSLELKRASGGNRSVVQVQPMPPLPRPCANMCGALVGTRVFIAGGIESPLATSAMRTAWTLDLSVPTPQWEEIDPWPGPARMLSVAGSDGRSFFVFGGAGLHGDADGKLVRRYLRDVYCYTPGNGWKTLMEMPRAAVGAPSPAPLLEGSLLVISGDDGTLAKFQPMSEHPGFPRDVLAFDLEAASWKNIGVSPLSRATVPVVEWRGRHVIPNGETRPGIRTPEVWNLSLE